MKLSPWNRFRHDTFNRDEELPFTPKAAVATVVNAAAKRKFRLASPHSKVQLDEDGSNEIEVSLEPSTVAPRSNSCSDSSVSSAPAALVVQGMFIQ